MSPDFTPITPPIPPTPTPPDDDPVSTLIARVAPEDVRARDYVIGLYEIEQYVLRDCEDLVSGRPRLFVVCARTIATYQSIGRVRRIALPFLVVECPEGLRLIDTRLIELGLVPAPVGAFVLRDLDRARRKAARLRAKRRARRATTSAPHGHDPREGAD